MSEYPTGISVEKKMRVATPLAPPPVMPLGIKNPAQAIARIISPKVLMRYDRTESHRVPGFFMISPFYTTTLIIRFGTMMIFFGFFASSHFADNSWPSTHASISAMAIFNGSSSMKRVFPLKETG